MTQIWELNGNSCVYLSVHGIISVYSSGDGDKRNTQKIKYDLPLPAACLCVSIIPFG